MHKRTMICTMHKHSDTQCYNIAIRIEEWLTLDLAVGSGQLYWTWWEYIE